MSNTRQDICEEPLSDFHGRKFSLPKLGNAPTSSPCGLGVVSVLAVIAAVVVAVPVVTVAGLAGDWVVIGLTLLSNFPDCLFSWITHPVN